MQISLLKTKVHRAEITDANLFYEGSLTLDEDLMDAAGLVEYEKVHVVNVNNGARLKTYLPSKASVARTRSVSTVLRLVSATAATKLLLLRTHR